MKRTWMRRGLSSGAAVTLLVGLGLTALPSAAVAKPAAAKLDSLTVVPAVQSLTSSTHKHLHLSLAASESNQNGATSSATDVTVTRVGAPEQHLWVFQLKSGSVSFNPSTGKGKLSFGSQIEPFGKVNLSLVRQGKKKVFTCGTFKTTTQPVKVSGVLGFDTRSTGKNKWGKVGSTKKRRTLTGKSVVTYQTGTPNNTCTGNFVFPCASGINWNSFKSNPANNAESTSFAGSVRGAQSMIFTSRNVSLKKPKNAFRQDSANIKDRHMKFTVKGGKATVTLGAQGPITGSAKLTSPQSGRMSPLPCGKAGKVEHQTSWSSAYKNGKSPLTVHEQIEGSIRLPNLPFAVGGTTSIERTTVS